MLRRRTSGASSQSLRGVLRCHARTVLTCCGKHVGFKVLGGAQLGHLVYCLCGTHGEKPNHMARPGRKAKTGRTSRKREQPNKSDYFTQPGKRGAVIVLR